MADAHAPNPTCEGNYAGEHGDDAEEGHWAEESGLAYARGEGDDGEERGYAQDQEEEEDLAAKILLKGEAGSGKSVALAALAHAMRKHCAVVCCPSQSISCRHKGAVTKSNGSRQQQEHGAWGARALHATKLGAVVRLYASV